ncbi:FecR family protein [Dyadobacter endophyticus]|uniref:Iron dicitrate transporter FecR n=1 Tax=Dyadobacter endophyticus TaxID=1749036 RepID=A0ABQ1Z414_9BACT|nr:FecR domain-containing protein [Dyadobacter endophyticus]GGH48947.1 iron dicitrate transporter FecR [Dyadobacter endophyticus]
MNKRDISSELLKRYTDGQCTPEEVFLVDEWYASLSEETGAEAAFDQLRHLGKVQDEIRRQSPGEASPGEASRGEAQVLPLRLRRLRVFMNYAAAIVLLIGGITTWYVLSQNKSAFKFGSNTVAIVNKTRQVRKHIFPDGSEAWLNPGTRLTYAKEDFKEDSREVSLEGEAFFEVTHDPSRPFFVHGESVQVKVLGTSFNVRANKGEAEYEVSVVTGKVSVTADKGREVMLLPHQQAVFKVASGELRSGEVPEVAGKAPLWQPVSLTFTDAKLGEVVKRLEDKFDVKIRLENPNLENCRVKATFDENRLSEILDMTMQIVDARYAMQNDEIVIRGEGCAASE